MKAMKKVLAFVLALAMVVTAVPVTNAAAKTANLPAGKTVNKSYYTGKTHTLKLTGVTKAKVQETNWTTSNANVVKFVAGTKTKVSAQFKCVKKGVATVTAKVTLKTGKTKTYKAIITVKKPTLTVDSGMTLTVGETKALTVKKTPSGAKLAYSSSNPDVATVSGKKITAVSAGNATITVQLTNGTKKITKKVNVTVTEPGAETSGLKLEPTLTNPFAEGKNVVLVGQNATIDVKCTQDGKPVAGKSIVMTIDNEIRSDDNKYEVVHPQMITDENGVAQFVIRYPKTTGKITETSERANIPYVVRAQGDNVSTKSNVAFASVDPGSLAVKVVRTEKVDGKDVTITNLVPGLNFTKTYSAADAVVTTADMADPTAANDEYVMSQQVSPEGTDKHAVTFEITGGYPKLSWPDSKAKTTSTSNSIKTDEEAVFDSGAYHVYTNAPSHAQQTNTVWTYDLKADYNKGLIYATVHFTDLKLSGHTKLVIECNGSDSSKNPLYTKTIDGESNQGNFDYQIPKDPAVKSVKAYIVSEGQVDLGMNSGYKVNGVTYVYENDANDKVEYKGGSENIRNVEIKWEAVTNSFTDERVIYPYTADKEKDSKYDIEGVKGGKLTEKLPAFPYTGTAVLTRYDAEGNKSYFAVETKNGGLVNGGKDKDNTKNSTVNTNVVPDTGLHVYEIDADELNNPVGSITSVSEDGRRVVVNSEKSGRSTLKATISINGQELNGGNESVYGESYGAKYGELYTSVLWNPVENDKNTNNGPAKKGFVALLGQNIEVLAQLTDRNGNKVTTAGKTIDFKYLNSASGLSVKIADNAARLNAYVADEKNTSALNGVKVVDLKTKTDAYGQAKITLTASDIRMIDTLQAECTDNNYNVQLSIKGVSAEAADLYWVDANLNFDTSAIAKENQHVATTLAVPKQDVNGIEPQVGSLWEYGVYVYATTPKRGVLADKWVSVDNLDLHMADKVAGNVGEVKSVENHMDRVTATSEKVGKTQIVSKIDSKSVNDKTTMSTDENLGTYAGTGATSISKRLTLNVQWVAKGIDAVFVTPNGANIYDVADAPDSVDVYVKVTDSYGNPMPAGTQVKFTKNTPDTSIKFVDADPATGSADADNRAKTVGTDKYGIAKVTMYQILDTPGERTIVSATVTGKSSGITQTYTWVKPSTDIDILTINTECDSAGNYMTNYDNKNGIITLNFKADIVKSSLNKDMVEAWYDKDSDRDHAIDTGLADVTKFIIKDVNVNNNVVTITVTNPIGTIDAMGYVQVNIKNNHLVDSVSYTMTSEDGKRYDGTEVAFIIPIEPEKNTLGFKESKHEFGLNTAAVAEKMTEVITEQIEETFVAGRDEFELLSSISGDLIGMGALAKAQVTWESSNVAVVDFEDVSVVSVTARSGSAVTVTTGSAIAKALSSGFSILTATIQPLISEDGVWVAIGAGTTKQYLVSVDTENKFACMVPYATNLNEASKNVWGFDAGTWGVCGVLNFDKGVLPASGIPNPDFNTYQLGGVTLAWQSTNAECIEFSGSPITGGATAGVNSGGWTITPKNAGNTQLIATVSHGSDVYTVTYDATVDAYRNITYKKVVINKVK